MRPEKELLLEEIKEKIDRSSAMIVARYQKLEPNAVWNLRSGLSGAGGFLEVVRKRVFLKAAEKAGFSFKTEELPGNIGVFFVEGEDFVPAAKTVFKFSEENENTLEVLFGRVGKEAISGRDLETLAKLPGKDEMRANLLALLTAPMSQLLSVLEAAIEARSSSAEPKNES